MSDNGHPEYRRVFKNAMFYGTLKFTLGVWTLYLSSLYMSRNGNLRLKIIFWPDSIVYLMFGVVVAYIYDKYYEVMYDQYDLAVPKRLFFFIGDVFAFTAFFSIVLFPLSGFGIFQWGLMAYFIFSNLVLAKNNDFMRFFEPLSLLILGMMMFIIKVGSQYLLSQNPYQQFISGNTTMRWLIFGIAAVFAVKYIWDLFKTRKDVNMAKSSSLASKVLGIGLETTKKIGKVIISTGLLLPLIGLCLVCGVALIFVVIEAQSDFWKSLGNLLEKALTTDSLRILYSESMTWFQYAAFIVFLLSFLPGIWYCDKFIKDRKKLFKKFLKKHYPPEFIKHVNNDESFNLLIKDGKTIVSDPVKFYDSLEDEYQYSSNLPEEYGKPGERKHLTSKDDFIDELEKIKKGD